MPGRSTIVVMLVQRTDSEKLRELLYFFTDLRKAYGRVTTGELINCAGENWNNADKCIIIIYGVYDGSETVARIKE